MPFETIRWIGDEDGYVELIDQTKLPLSFEYIRCKSIEEMWEDIRNLRIRGAPALGIAGGMGLLLGVQDSKAEGFREFLKDLREAKSYLESSRPTAVNLFWALDRMERRAEACSNRPVKEIKTALLREALSIQEEDKRICRALGRNGAELLKDEDCVLTHCNAGGLATADYGTALAVFYAAKEEGKNISAFADETRPLLQGARLTTWELMENDIPVTLICDSMAAQVMREGKIDAVIVGADRIAANGDAANKIGTYGLSILARAHDIPFYVVAPVSTFDFALPDGCQIPIEERDPAEITCWGERQTAPDGIDVYNPAFDVTPAANINAIVTEKGVIHKPDAEKIAGLQKAD